MLGPNLISWAQKCQLVLGVIGHDCTSGDFNTKIDDGDVGYSRTEERVILPLGILQ